MKTHLFTPTKPTRYLRVLPVIFLSMFLVTACEKSSESETVNETTTDAAVQTTPVTSNINIPEVTDREANAAETTVDSAQDVSLNELEKDLEPTDSAANNAAVAPNPEQAIKGAQITDVRYKSAAGESLSVVFETSAAGVLNAIVTLPNKPKMTLSAPEGQGNNPTYRSSDGSIQLVSHAGGGSIDFIRNNKVTSFDAVSAEAEVITE
ncbi:hypothetical protein HQR03_01170 [Psychrobacter okhotskensis]|uniref:hypothetical protein n=1 Tax=Psychrobacter okhotskensis TaxID=212403 RepID=UPI001567B26B|nr:hypothetical protein [Psychrobacter okhotskensis]NRD69152.1 hypothetical protein [Psychrobacter okhotskensis]